MNGPNTTFTSQVNMGHVTQLPTDLSPPAQPLPTREFVLLDSATSQNRQRSTTGDSRFQHKLNKIFDAQSTLPTSDKRSLPVIKKTIEDIRTELASTTDCIQQYEGKKQRYLKAIASLEHASPPRPLALQSYKNKLKDLESTGKHLDQKLDKVLSDIKGLQTLVEAIEIASKETPANKSDKPAASSHAEGKDQARQGKQTTTPSRSDQGAIAQGPTQHSNTNEPALPADGNQPKSGTPEHAFNQHQEMANRQQAIQLAMTSMSNVQNIFTTMQQSATAQVSAMCNQILDGVKAINDLMKKGGAMSSGAIGQ